MKSRFIVLLALLVMIAALVPAVSAQADVNCLGLNGDDCTIITTATENIASMQSFTQVFTFELSVSGAAAMTGGMDGVSLKADGGGPFVINTSVTDPAQMLNMGININGSLSGTGDDQSGSFELVVVDGVGYVKNPATSEWKGAKLDELLASFSEQAGAMAGGTSGASGGGLEGLTSNPAAMGLATAFMSFDPMKIPGFLSQERQADAELMGQKMVAFNYTADVGAFLTSPDFQNLVTQSAGVAGQASPDAAQMAMMVPMLAGMASGNVNYSRWVGADDGFIHRIAIAADINLDLSAMMGSSGGSDASMPPINMKMNLTVDLSEINSTTGPTAPEGATIVPAKDLMG